MERRNLRRDQLVTILRDDQRRSWSRLALMDGLPEQARRELTMIHQLWERVLGEIAEVRAQRLLDSTWKGTLLTTTEVMEKALQVARQLGTFQLPGAPPQIRDIIVEPCIDFSLSLGIIGPFIETPEELWERVEMICHLAGSFHTSPEEFYRNVPDAEDWILRFTTTPDLYRRAEQEQIDAKHPDVVTRRIKTFEDTVRRRLGVLDQMERFRIHLHFVVLQGADYWRYRAYLLQRLEERIARVWPNQRGDIV